MKRMMLMGIKKGWIGIFLIVLSAEVASAKQTDKEGPSLTEKYSELMEESETYEKYKVIAISKLDAFWKEVEDSVGAYRKDIAEARLETSKINETLLAANDSLGVVNEKLTASEEINNEIYFMGMSLDKAFYNIVVWSIIGGLMIFLLVLYTSFRNSHLVTNRAKKDLFQVTEELENLRQRSNEKQVKLKRELQTALNQLDEFKRKVPAGR